MVNQYGFGKRKVDMKNKTIEMGVVAAFVCFTFICFSWAQGPQNTNKTAAAAVQADDDSFTVETVSGEITGINRSSISVLYDHDYDAGVEYEVLIPTDENTVFKHKRNLKELKVGDLISAEYEKPVEGSKHKGRAKVINFIQSGVKNLVTEALPDNSGVEAEAQ
jgi:hypothetical protein